MMRHLPRLMLFTPPSSHPRRFDLAAIVHSDPFSDIEAAEQAKQDANYDNVVTRLLILVHGYRPSLSTNIPTTRAIKEMECTENERIGEFEWVWGVYAIVLYSIGVLGWRSGSFTYTQRRF
ncbi:hypothetical protein M438DRAFT_347814 [Aureobasidium pullulans EXF-150]|uniref:Uncharacterized protein n=1 Tax=Aureobasidium pullulans EXF-150 TaxID=1043002 RepID=A0A074X8Q0_AURPU|nr:uncharacterized protein M438DRAFT_347814 [Aureobasidium pullulans EXF-150]KEQ81723.1 hypothetical protein M438DRAFT_347814 [Aureobasidium pullulans EXF-150]